MSKPRVLVLQAAGTNCDTETAHAFALAGGDPQFVHIHALLADAKLLDGFKILAIPGGFSYGDDISAGRILGLKLSQTLAEPLKRFVESGRLVAGICNGFQVLVKTDLLPGPVAAHAGLPTTLAHNNCGHFVDRWITLTENAASKCIWTKNLGTLELPIAHGEGQFVTASPAILSALESNGQVALRYARPALESLDGPYNPNGSQNDIAGICDSTGRVFGLMPHPERYVRHTQHYAWTRSPEQADAPGPGLRVFQNAISHAAGL